MSLSERFKRSHDQAELGFIAIENARLAIPSGHPAANYLRRLALELRPVKEWLELEQRKFKEEEDAKK